LAKTAPCPFPSEALNDIPALSKSWQKHYTNICIVQQKNEELETFKIHI
jgi:hypothetical protein